MVPREGHLPGLQRRVQGQRGEAVITGDVLLKTAGEGSRENTVWLVGTIPGLLIRRLANTTCALAVSLKPCLLAKPLRESREPSRWWGGRCSEPLVPVHLLQSPRSAAGTAGDGGDGECRGGRFRIAHCPLWTSPPQQKSHLLPHLQKPSFNSQTTQMKCHGKFDKNQEEVKLTLGGRRGK